MNQLLPMHRFPNDAPPSGIDLGLANMGEAMARGYSPEQFAALSHVSPVKRMIAESRMLIQRGEDPRLALNHLRPCVDSPIPGIAFNATLRRDEWVQFDDTVIQANQETLRVVGDFLGAGLRYNIGNPFGTPVIEAERIGEMSAAQIAMYAGTPPQDDRVIYDLWGVPVPIISKGFWLDDRVLEASRQRGPSLDTTNADAATRVVNEKIEEMVFTGAGVTYGGYTLYGLTNHPNVNTGSLSGAWSTLARTNPGAIVSDVISMKTALTGDLATGPYMVYIPRTWIDSLDLGYFETTAISPDAVTGLVAPSQTIRQRLLQMNEIQDIRPTSRLTSGVVVVSMTRKTVDIAYGFEPRLIQWESQGGLVNHFRVIAIMSVRVKADQGGKSGIAYFTA